MKSVYTIDTPLGLLHAMEEDGRVTAVYLPGLPHPAPEGKPQTDLARELGEYFTGKRKHFDVPLGFDGAPFQMKALLAARTVPYGGTTTYAALAAAAGNPRAARAAGRAMATNPLPILIPCHRVLYSSGKKQKYAGGPEMKNWILELEKKFK